MKEILEEYGSLLLAAAGGGLMFHLLSGILWSQTSAFAVILGVWQNRGL